jgi:hypothetical protein
MKTTKRPGVVDAKATTTQRLNVRVDAAAYERLLIHAIKARKSPGEIVSKLIESHLRTWRIQENSPSRGKGMDRLDIADPVMDSEVTLPSQVAA